MRKNRQLGFTLVELMVAVSIFAIVAVIAVGALLTANRINQKAQATKLVVDNLNFAMDSMSLRMRGGGPYYCITSFHSNDGSDGSEAWSWDYDGGNNCVLGGNGGEAIAFVSRDKKYIYRLCRLDESGVCASGNGVIQISEEGPSGQMENFVSITATAIDVDSFKFYVEGYVVPPQYKPRALITLSATGYVGQDETKIALESVVSERN